MKNPSQYLDSLIDALASLPGIGSKSASRLAFHILKMPKHQAEALARSIIDLKINIRTCAVCGGISDSDTCSICSDSRRDRGQICVVAEARDVLTIERTGEYRGVYHVLSGLISPLDGIGPDELNLSALASRLGSGGILEIILALNPTVEGDATSLYIAKLFGGTGARITRIAHGLPVGADMEYADSATIIRSIENRVDM